MELKNPSWTEQCLNFWYSSFATYSSGIKPLFLREEIWLFFFYLCSGLLWHRGRAGWHCCSVPQGKVSAPGLHCYSEVKSLQCNKILSAGLEANYSGGKLAREVTLKLRSLCLSADLALRRWYLWMQPIESKCCSALVRNRAVLRVGYSCGWRAEPSVQFYFFSSYTKYAL